MRQIWEQKMSSPQICHITFHAAGPGGRKSDDANLGAEDAFFPQICLVTFPSAGPGGRKSDEANFEAEDTISPNVPHLFSFRWAWRREKG